MANRRMFSKTITSSSKFISLPLDVQGLYFQISMSADDDGYCDCLSILRMTLSDINLVYHLATSGFLLVYQNYIVKIVHWDTNNQLRKDRYTPSVYKDKELQPLDFEWQPNGNQMATNDCHSVVKGSIGKKEKNNTKKESSNNLPDWLDKPTWSLWLKHNKKKGNSLPETTIDFQLKRLAKHKKDHVAIIHQSIERNYKGLFPLKDNNKNQGLSNVLQPKEEGKYDHL
jgi:hypothetical protein